MDSPPADPNSTAPLAVIESPEPLQTLRVSASTPRESKRQKRLVVDELYHYDRIGVKSATMERAEAFTSSLTPPGLPTFLKTMVRSNVATGFWLHLPMGFCKTHMPRHNSTVILQDVDGQEYEVNYIVEKTALSAGWKLFTTARKLMEGDVVIFQLVEPSRFKVYIIRANDPLITDGMSELDRGDTGTSSGNGVKSQMQRKTPRKRSKPVRKRSLAVAETQTTSAQGEPKEVREDTNLDSMEGSLVLGNSAVDFEEAKNTGNFTILVNGRFIDSELSNAQRERYYDLCMTQNSYLHGSLLKSISPKLAAEMISETVNIAATVKACEISTSQEEYLVWDKTLEGFELLGMRVGFLRTRLGRLKELASEFQKCRSAETRKDTAEQEMRAVREELLELKELRRKLDAEIEGLKASVDRHEDLFRQEASAGW